MDLICKKKCKDDKTCQVCVLGFYEEYKTKMDYLSKSGPVTPVTPYSPLVVTSPSRFYISCNYGIKRVSSIIIKFKEEAGDIPKDSLGLIRNHFLTADADYTKVFVPHHFVHLDKKELPCYTMPSSLDDKVHPCWIEISEDFLTEEEVQMLMQFEIELNDRVTLFIGPNGVMQYVQK